MEKLKPNCIVFFNGEIEGLEDALRTCAELGAQDFFFVVRDRDLKAFSKYAMSEGGFDLITENKENTEPKFTPGPWSIEKSEYPNGAGYYYINAKDKNIGGDVIVFQGINNMANAALIAAAPEMYYMLCNILNDLETGENISIADNTAFDIRGLLARARGEAETCKG